MSDLPEQIAGKVVGDLDPFKKILSYIPGFKGYMERQSRRDSDKLLRDTIANRFEERWQRVSAIQSDLINQGGLAYVDDPEAAAIQLRTFADRIEVLPPWEQPSAPEAGLLSIVINPGMAFGTGLHETTASCLELLVELVRPGDTQVKKLHQYTKALCAMSNDLYRFEPIIFYHARCQTPVSSRVPFSTRGIQ